MPLRAEAWLRWLEQLPPELGRRAIPADPERRAAGARLMAGLELPHQELYPWGLEAGHRLWEPWAAAREAVEAYPSGKQFPGAQADWIIHDREAATVTLATLAPLPSQCGRFARRECPRLAPMGHEPVQETCNYWDWEGKDRVAPNVELFPEWQRFDCHKYYPLFQLHLCGAALAQALNAELRIEAHGGEAMGKLAAVYAGFTSSPDAFSTLSLHA
jgi:hypothetical protein